MRSFKPIILAFLIAQCVIFAMCCVKLKRLNIRYSTLNNPSKATVPCGDRPINPKGVVLKIEHRPQEQPAWCTLSVFQAIRAYFNQTVEQCELANERANMIVSYSTSRTSTISCCDNKTLDCLEPTLTREDSALFYNSGIMTPALVEHELSEPEIQKELSNGRPIIASYFFTHDYCTNKKTNNSPLCSGHTTLLTGFIPPGISTNTSSVTLYIQIDPVDDSPTELTYAEIVAGRAVYKKWPWTKRQISMPRPWTQTWFKISQRPDGCNEVFDPLCGCGDPP